MDSFDFVALDVETANMDLWSICQVGLAYFKENQLVDTWCSLVNPECSFDGFNTQIHGITPQMVKNSIKLPQLHELMVNKLSNQVVIHHTHFDKSAFYRLGSRLQQTELPCTWLDSSRVARRTWEEIRNNGYGLSNIARLLEIKQDKTHDALDDAKIAGYILLKAINHSNKSLDQWVENSKKDFALWGTSAKEFIALANTDPNPDGPLFGEVLVFTGALSITRLEAAKIAFQLGCNIDDGVTKHTTLLVVGDQDSRRLAGYEKSSKHRKAEDLISKGQSIRIIGENDFFSMIN